jgi:hypothetical protein
MTLTLQLPDALSAELQQQAESAGLAPEEHATELLTVAAALLGRREPANLSGYRYQVVATMLQTVRTLLREEERSEADRVPAEAGPVSRPSAFGKYRGIIGSSDEYAELKQGEIDREDRRPA